MNYYKVVDAIKEAAEQTGFVKTVTHGELNEVALKRLNIYPILHIVPQSFQVLTHTTTFTFDIYFIDIVDMNKKDIMNEAEPFWGTDNSMDIANQAHIVASLLVTNLNNNERVENDFIKGELPVGGTFFADRFEDSVAGSQFAVTIETSNTAVTDGIC